MIDIAGHTTGEESGTFSALQNYEQIISKNKKTRPYYRYYLFQIGVQNVSYGTQSSDIQQHIDTTVLFI